MNTYQWFKAFHLIFMVAWFAGLFYIFRLFVYHVKHRDKAELAKVYSVMERKLIFLIMYPAMVLNLLFGLLMIAQAPSTLAQPWFQIKALGILALIGTHAFAAYVHSCMLRGDYPVTEKTCRLINEVPMILLVVIVLLAVLKP